MPTRRVLLASLLLCGLVAASAAHAAGQLVDVRIVDRSEGRTLPPYRHRGVEYVAGRPGNRYAVQMTNRTAARVLVVLSVDGINAISGETAAVVQTGYVLAPYASAEITGWRKSMTEAAAFYFTTLADSYASRTDRPDNVGVIGVAVFRERTPPPDLSAHAPAAGRERDAHDDGRRQAAPPAGESRANDAMASSEAARQDAASPPARKAERLGTGHGEREYAPTSHTAFERASSQPAELVRVRYDSHANLVAMGVIRAPERPFEPQPFARFAPDPR